MEQWRNAAHGKGNRQYVRLKGAVNMRSVPIYS